MEERDGEKVCRPQDYSIIMGDLQGVHKVLEPFVFAISSESFGAQKKLTARLKPIF
jgi:hypothetical protein